MSEKHEFPPNEEVKTLLSRLDVKGVGRGVLRNLVIAGYIIAAGYAFGVGLSFSYSPITISVEASE
ncbi:hypothetical protein [uncultured Methylophaga sp.]|uniref:hypothetical protein n=1 Tax=uncultured Methylophaga sp. TaxID=285271 RepID=UPI0026238612|nr:hypothetical protein [uncultured Methylophaga sp.]